MTVKRIVIAIAAIVVFWWLAWPLVYAEAMGWWTGKGAGFYWP